MNSWHIVTVGHLSRNKFWGEPETEGYHPVLATSTVIQTEYGNILVDPSLDGPRMADAVYHSCGLKPEGIHLIYSTHYHCDHWMGADVFPAAALYMAKGDLADLWGWREHFEPELLPVLERFQPADGELVPGVKLIALPGHTLGLQGLLFEAPEGRILITGDAVMNYEFFQAREGYFLGASQKLAARSIERAAKAADYIVPGHGNYFSVRSYPFVEEKVVVKTEEAAGQSFEETDVIGPDTKIGEIVKDREDVEMLRGFAPKVLTPIGIYMARDIPLGALMTTAGICGSKAEELIARLNSRRKDWKG